MGKNKNTINSIDDSLKELKMLIQNIVKTNRWLKNAGPKTKDERLETRNYQAHIKKNKTKSENSIN